MKNGYGEFIRKHRVASGYKSQRRLAEKTGISSATISRIESEIQKPELKTLQILAEYLETTSLVELMVKCGYWNEDELLESNLTAGKDNELVSKYLSNQITEKQFQQATARSNRINNEQEFIDKINLLDKDLLEQFDLIVDGKKLSEEETKGIIAYVRTLRQMRN